MLAFVPRSVSSKKDGSAKHTAPSVQSFNDQNVTKQIENDDSVKNFSNQQRWPDNDEPICKVCGKFGEYICDKTDDDVCSIQCKQKNLKCLNESESVLQQQPLETLKSTIDFDEHYQTCTERIQFASSVTITQTQFFREKLKISVSSGKNIPKLLFNFNDFDFNDKILENLVENDFVQPTVVQMQAIPIGLSGSDMLVSAATTSGKTASFLLPIIHRIHQCIGAIPSEHPFCKHPIALMLAPTRELCMQIEEQAKCLCTSLRNMKTALLIGGVPLPQQLHRLRHNIQLAIGTPGRINDILSKHEELFSLSQIKMVVLDEVDVMLQMGFQNQIQQIFNSLPPAPQYMMFSATIPEAIEGLARQIMRDPINVSVGLSGVANQSIQQLVLWVDEKSKKKKLFDILDDGKHFLPPALVFVDSKIGADMLCESILQRYRIRCESIHSDKSQDERTTILQSFLTGSYDILVTTNVMARGIDLVNVKQVIVFDMSKTLDEYVHQIGRAGSLHEKGYSICFINNSSKNIFLDLKELFEISETKLPEEILKSPYINMQIEKRKKLAYRDGKNKRVVNNDEDDNIDAQSLIEILTKKRIKRK